MTRGVPDVTRIAQVAGSAFAEKSSALDPTIDEASEELARAKAYRNNAPLLGGMIGLAAIVFVMIRR